VNRYKFLSWQERSERNIKKKGGEESPGGTNISEKMRKVLFEMGETPGNSLSSVPGIGGKRTAKRAISRRKGKTESGWLSKNC